MNETIFRTTILEKLTSTIMLVLLTAIVVVMPIVSVWIHSAEDLGGAEQLLHALGITLVVSAGAIGRQVAAGTLALVFCRPVGRAEFVLTKWAALSLLAFALAALQLAVLCVGLAVTHQAPHLAAVCQDLVERATVCAGVTAVLVLLSSFVPGHGDVALWFLLYAVCGVCTATSNTIAHAIGSEGLDQLKPGLHYAHVFHSSPIVWSALFGYVSTVLLCLSAASFIMSNKELSYAS